MGKGDRKTAKGKRYNSSYGNARKQTSKGAVTSASASAKKRTKPSRSPASSRRCSESVEYTTLFPPCSKRQP